MNSQVIAAVVSQLGVMPKQFAAGWMEGRMRYQTAANKNVIAGSILEPGTVAFAASQAAVAFHQALDDD